MRCGVCGREIEENVARCGTCGFPVLQIPLQDTNTDYEQKIRQMTDVYRYKILAGIDLALIVYLQEKKENIKRLNQEKIITLARCQDLKENEIVWADRLFAKTDEKNLELIMGIRRQDDNYKYFTFSIQAPQGSGLWHAGVKNTGSMNIQLVLANDQEMTASQIVSLTDMIDFV